MDNIMRASEILIICVLFKISCGEEPFNFGDKVHTSTLQRTCGRDNSPIKVVYEGLGIINTYPWLGTLYYPINNKRFITSVVLVNKQLVLGSAIDIDKLPKKDFRARARVVLGNTCSGPSIRVREYSYHPAYNKTTFSAPVLIQLKYSPLMKKLRPICSPPSEWQNPEFYAITLAKDCKDSNVEIHKMSHVNLEECKSYYKENGLDIASMWPTHTVCARTLHGEECVWRNGAVLMLRQNDTWSLIGFGVAGPGCRAPARFIDYTMNYLWTSNNIARIGVPTVSRLAKNHVVLRRTSATLQRYGECDPEEVRGEIYSDTTNIMLGSAPPPRRARYNFTIFSKMEYTCVIFKVENPRAKFDPPVAPAVINLYRICTSPKWICYSTNYLQIDFYVEIIFTSNIKYTVAAYGHEMPLLDIKKTMVYINRNRIKPPIF